MGLSLSQWRATRRMAGRVHMQALALSAVSRRSQRAPAMRARAARHPGSETPTVSPPYNSSHTILKTSRLVRLRCLSCGKYGCRAPTRKRPKEPRPPLVHDEGDDDPQLAEEDVMTASGDLSCTSRAFLSTRSLRELVSNELHWVRRAHACIPNSAARSCSPQGSGCQQSRGF